MARIDLDAAGAARREAEGEPIEVVFRGETFTLPPEPSFKLAGPLAKIARLLREAEKVPDAQSRMLLQAETIEPLLEIGEIVLGREQWSRFEDLGPSQDDIATLFDGITKTYGLGGGLGEAPSSPSPSSSTGPRSRRSSKPRTKST